MKPLDKDNFTDEQMYVYEVLSSIASDTVNRFLRGLEELGINRMVDEKTLLEVKATAIDRTLAGWDIDDFALKSYELRRPK